MYYYNDKTGKRVGPFNETQLQIKVKNREVFRETLVETDRGHRGRAEQLNFLNFPPPPPSRNWLLRVFDGLFSAFGRLVAWTLSMILLLLAVIVLASAIGTAVCVLAYQDGPWVVGGWVPPNIQCSSRGAYLESVRKTKEWWYVKREKGEREEHKKTMDELIRLATLLKDETLDFAEVQESMLDQFGKQTIQKIDADELSKSIDRWLEKFGKPEEPKPEYPGGGDNPVEPVKPGNGSGQGNGELTKEEFDTLRINSDTIDKMKNSGFGEEFKQDCDFLSNSLSWSQQDLLTALNGMTAKEAHTYRQGLNRIKKSG